MSNAWSHLPNAHNIDWVLKSLKENSELWVAALDAARAAAWDAARAAAWDAGRAAAWDAGRAAAWENVWIAARFAARFAARAAAFDAAMVSILALIAYDDCDQFLSMSYERLKVWAVLSEDSRAVLLLPMVYVKKQLLQEVVV